MKYYVKCGDIKGVIDSHNHIRAATTLFDNQMHQGRILFLNKYVFISERGYPEDDASNLRGDEFIVPADHILEHLGLEN